MCTCWLASSTGSLLTHSIDIVLEGPIQISTTVPKVILAMNLQACVRFAQDMTHTNRHEDG